ncbi:MAG TPA: hypothetical protein VJB59_06185 [Bdellovibrionota bacterium]|nr:hypothetical protein [Bdellovibrionota bacterium]
MNRRLSALIFAFLFSALATSSGSAEPKCPSLRRWLIAATKNLKNQHLDGIPIKLVKEGDLKPAQMRKMFEPISKLNRTGTHLEKPEFLEIVASRFSDDPEFTPFVNRLRVPYRFKDPSGQTKSPKSTQVMIAHEYGHAVFYATLKKRHPTFYKKMSELHAKLREIEQVTSGIEARQREIEKLLGEVEASATPSKEKMNELATEHAKLRSSLIQASEKEKITHAEYGPYKQLLAPYGEFFADTVVVQAYRDPSIIRRVLDFPGTKNDPSKIALRSRDFSVRHVLDSWDYEEPHVLLGPSRHEVWNRYLSQPELANRPEPLSRVFDAIVSELKARDITAPPLSPAELNRRLMKALENEFERPL